MLFRRKKTNTELPGLDAGNNRPVYPAYRRNTIDRRTPTILAVDTLIKKYGPRTVVKGVSFEVHEGEVVGLLGPNGAGKTTSFRMTCGLIPANSGRVELGGLDVTDWPMYRRAREGRMGYLPQDRSVFGSLTTEKNLYLAMELLGIPKKEHKKRCEELLEKFTLAKVRKTIVGAGGTGGLSGGERRRLEIARALLSEPQILLLDEPFANVDPNTVTEIQNVVRELSAEGIAILITDHQIDATMEIADYCYVIAEGAVLTEGTPVEVLSNEEARTKYFGEKSEQQLDNLKKKIASGSRHQIVPIPSEAGNKTNSAIGSASGASMNPPVNQPVNPSSGSPVIHRIDSAERAGEIQPPQTGQPVRRPKKDGFVVSDADGVERRSFQIDSEEILPPPKSERSFRVDSARNHHRNQAAFDDYADEEETIYRQPAPKRPMNPNQDRRGGR